MDSGREEKGRDGKDRAEPGTGHGSGMVGPVLGYVAQRLEIEYYTYSGRELGKITRCSTSLHTYEV